MNDITALAQRMKAAAEKAIADEGLTWWSEEQLASDYGLSLHPADAKFIALASHENVLALVEALEKAQSELERYRTAFHEWSDKTEWVQKDKRFDVLKPWGKHRADVLKEYIEHLESRTVTVKLPEYRNSPDMHTKQYYEAIGFNQGLDVCLEALTAAGIQVIEGER